MGVAYFDLTEDVEVTDYIKNLNTKTFYDASVWVGTWSS